jgi:putative transposase
MTRVTTKADSSLPQNAIEGHLFDNWIDPLETAIRGRIRGIIEELIHAELDEVLARHRHGSRRRKLMGTFGKVEIDVPRARLQGSDGKTSEWKSSALRTYQRRTVAADALIASTYLAGTNTRRVRRALTTLFSGAVSKDTVSRIWRKVKTDWEAWNARSLAAEPIVRLILDGTAARPQGNLDVAAGRYGSTRRRSESAARDQEHGRRKQRGLAHSSR